jgi:hypothetical protein
MGSGLGACAPAGSWRHSIRANGAIANRVDNRAIELVAKWRMNHITMYIAVIATVLRAYGVPVPASMTTPNAPQPSELQARTRNCQYVSGIIVYWACVDGPL